MIVWGVDNDCLGVDNDCLGVDNDCLGWIMGG